MLDTNILLMLVNNLQQTKKAVEYKLTHRDLNIPADTTQVKDFSGDETWFIINADSPIRVESNSGIYDKNDQRNPENEYVHEGGVTIKNMDALELGSVQFLIVRWIYQKP